MNKLKRIAFGTVASALMFGSLAGGAFAAKPEVPNCLGQDLSGLVQALSPWGQFILNSPFGNLTNGGFDNEILGHLQGASPLSTCPDDGFPTPLH